VLTLPRFKKLVAVYGAKPTRWPSELRDEAQALLQASPEARAVLADARRADEAIEAAMRHDDTALSRAGAANDALARLRLGVARRIAAEPDRRRSGWFTPAGSSRFTWGTGGVALGALAVLAGIMVGWWYQPMMGSESLLDSAAQVAMDVVSE
jgi:hypothetical protein